MGWDLSFLSVVELCSVKVLLSTRTTKKLGHTMVGPHCKHKIIQRKETRDCKQTCHDVNTIFMLWYAFDNACSVESLFLCMVLCFQCGFAMAWLNFLAVCTVFKFLVPKEYFQVVMLEVHGLEGISQSG